MPEPRQKELEGGTKKMAEVLPPMDEGRIESKVGATIKINDISKIKAEMKPLLSFAALFITEAKTANWNEVVKQPRREG